MTSFARPRLTSALLVSTLVASLAGQARWHRQPTVSCRSDAAAAYDSHRQRVVLHGGRVLRTQDDTWEWDGATWREIATAARPVDLMSLQGMNYDSARRRMVLIGLSYQYQPRTWEYNGSTWTRVGDPPFVARPAYDDVRQRTVLAGFDTRSQQGVWEWDGATWSLRAAMPFRPVAGPLVRDPVRRRIVTVGTDQVGQLVTGEWDGSQWTWINAAPGLHPYRTPRTSGLAWDAATQRVILFGGATQSQLLLDDTWEWNGTTWTQRTGSAAPAPRSDPAMVGDDARGRVLLVGGANAVGPLGDTWALTGSQWSLTADEGGPQRMDAALAYDGARRQIVLFGGNDPA